jgi:hypothetical protein
MPEDEGEVIPLFAFLAEFEQSSLSGCRTEQLDDEPVDLFILRLLGIAVGVRSRTSSLNAAIAIAIDCR